MGFIVVSSEKDPFPASRYLTAAERVDALQVQTPEGFSSIRRFLKDFRAHGLLIIDESIALWLHHASRGDDGFPPLWCPGIPRLLRVLDKSEQIEAARHVGLAVLPTVKIEASGNRVPRLASEFFPVCVRPTSGGVEPFFKVRLFHDQRDLEAFVSGLKTLTKPLICQPFRNLPNLVVHGSRSEAGDVYGLQAFVVPRKFEGVTLTIAPVPMPEGLARPCREFLDRLDVVGPFHFEFLWDPGQGIAWFLEINNRLGGTTAKVLACGYDEPGYALKAFGVPVPGLDNGRPLRPVCAAGRQALMKYMASALTGRLTPLDFPVESARRSVSAAMRSFFSCRDDVWAWDDIPGSLSLYGANVCSKLEKRLPFFRAAGRMGGPGGCS